jgi:hypothetical protein
MLSASSIPDRILRGLVVLGLAGIALGTSLSAQTVEPTTNTIDGRQHYDWLSIGQNSKADGTVSTTTQDIKDPYTVISTGALWQEQSTSTYTRPLDDGLTLSYASSSSLMSETSSTAPSAAGTPDGMDRGQKVGLQFQPLDQFSVAGNVHASTTDGALPGSSVVTSGAGFTTQGKLPTNSVVVFGVNTDRTSTDTIGAYVTTDTSCDAQLSQPVGSLPLSAVLKAHYEETQVTGSPLGKMPSLEQSVTWKPAQDTSIQMGLRQQQYQEYPGVDNQFNTAIFADFSQKLAGTVTWHSYGELMNTRGLIDQAPAAPIANGTNGTAQATTPSDNLNLASSVPLSLQDQTLTLTTGPSFQLQKDISASVEYSNRWDKNPAPGSIGQEQRVSLSVKGSF